MKKTMIANFGDVNYIDHGGYLVYSDGSVDVIVLNEEDDTWQVFTFDADKCDPAGEWFGKYLPEVCQYADRELAELTAGFQSDDIEERARSYQDLGSFAGWGNFDSYATTFDRAGIEKWDSN